METINQGKRHIIHMLTVIMMIMIPLFVISQDAAAATGKAEVYQTQDVTTSLPAGYIYLDKQNYGDGDAVAVDVSIYGNLNAGDVIAILSMKSDSDLSQSSAVKASMAEYLKGALDELKVDYSLTDMMHRIKAETISGKTVYTLNEKLENSGVITLKAVNLGNKLYMFNYLKVNSGDLSHGDKMINQVMKSI